MVNLFDAFVEFVSTHSAISNAEKNNLSQCLKNLLDADPEKEIMRRALEHYANEYNWCYITDASEGARLARDALAASNMALKSCLLSMYENKNIADENHDEVIAESILRFSRH